MGTKAAARTLLLLAGALLLLALGPGIGARLLSTPDPGAGRRVLSVLVVVVSVMPCMIVVGWMTLRSDEYAREGLLQSMGLALGFSIGGLAAADALMAAGILGWDSLPPAWQIVLLLWGLAIVVVRIARSR